MLGSVEQLADIQNVEKHMVLKQKWGHPPACDAQSSLCWAYVRPMFGQDGTYVRRLDHIKKR